MMFFKLKYHEYEGEFSFTFVLTRIFFSVRHIGSSSQILSDSW